MPVELPVPAAATALATLEAVKLYMGISGTTQDAKLTAIIPAAEAAVKTYCDQNLVSDTYTDYVSGEDSYKWSFLALQQRPITSVTSIHRWNGADYITALVEIDDYRVNGDEVLGRFVSGWQNHKVIYTAGYTTIPDDLQQATCMVVKSLFDRSNKAAGVASEKIGDYAYSLANETSDTATIPAEAKLILNKYKRVSL